MTEPLMLVPIVEGDGEVQAFPILLRRLAPAIAPDRAVDVTRPIRVNRSKIVKEGELERWLQSRRTDGLAYSPTLDQPALSALVDLDIARAGSPSFDKLWREVEKVLSDQGGRGDEVRP